jgi:hypothetical protein
MTALVNRLADRMLRTFAPRLEAAAACTYHHAYYCYCSGGLAYRSVCYNCDGSFVCGRCQPSGTC